MGEDNSELLFSNTFSSDDLSGTAVVLSRVDGGRFLSSLILAWFLWSGKVGEKSEDHGKSGNFTFQSQGKLSQGKSGNLKVPGCKS